MSLLSLMFGFGSDIQVFTVLIYFFLPYTLYSAKNVPQRGNQKKLKKFLKNFAKKAAD